MRSSIANLAKEGWIWYVKGLADSDPLTDGVKGGPMWPPFLLDAQGEAMLSSFSNYVDAHPWLAVLIAGSLGLITAWFTITSQRTINRRRATVDMLGAKLWDRDYIQATDRFYHAMKDQRKLMKQYDQFVEAREHKANGTWDELPDEKAQEYTESIDVIQKVRLVLNDRELVAIGIRDGSYDEVIYRRWWYSTLLQEWHQAAPLIARIRSDVQTGAPAAAYCEYENLVCRWQAEGQWTQRDRHIRFPGGRIITISRSR